MNRLKYIAAAVILVVSVSCNKWLDIKPKGQAEASDILKDEKGYNYALGGVYYRLSSEALYGKDMTFGAMDALAKYWDFSNVSTHDYKNLSDYQYTNANAVTITNSFFNEFYLAIAQCNQILESLNVNGNEISNSDLFKGETLALRAHMHFELLKIFGPVVRSKADLNKKAISYRTKFNVIATEFNTIEEVLNYAVIDLKAALELLKNDPINVNGREGDGNGNLLDYSNILKRRGTRMNYYAVLGILARIEMWRDNKSEAYRYATRLIDESKKNSISDNPVIMITPKDNMGNASESTRDILCQREFIFALFRDDLDAVRGPIFMFKEYKSALSSKTISISADQFADITNFMYGRQPDGAGTDLRLKYWFAKHELLADKYQFNKLKKMRDSRIGYGSEIPVMKMSEIYYIACECQIGIDNALAIKYLNEVRFNRGLPNLEGTYGNEVLEDFLMREMRKDFFGEGVMFGIYKRKFKPIEASATKTILPSESNFLMPIPDDEYEFSPNGKPSK